MVIYVLALDIANGISAIADYIVDFIKFCAVWNVYFTTQSVLLKTIKTNIVHMLYFESGRHATRIVGDVRVGAAAGADITEAVGVAGTGRTLPPIGSSISSIMQILYLAVSRRVIAVLFEII